MPVGSAPAGPKSGLPLSSDVAELDSDHGWPSLYPWPRTGHRGHPQAAEDTTISKGTVKKVVPDPGFGFLTAEDGRRFLLCRADRPQGDGVEGVLLSDGGYQIRSFPEGFPRRRLPTA